MRVTAHPYRPGRILILAAVVAICSAPGCYAPHAREFPARAPDLTFPAEPVQSAGLLGPGVSAIVVEPPRSKDAQAVAAAPSSVETWIIQTRACDQKLGSDPWSTINVGRLDETGGPIHGADPEVLLARMTGRTSVVFIHGSGYTYNDSVAEGAKIRAVLEANDGLPPEALFVIFDWPSERERGDLIQDLNEQARRSRVAAFHFARFLQSAPPGSRICLLGQSNGGRIVLTTMHLLAGASLKPFWTEPEVRLSSGRPDLRIRAVVLDTAAGHHWLNPGQRLDQALPMCESLFALRNCADYALSVYILGVYTGLRPALGQVGLLPGDLKALGPLAARVEQMNLHSRVGFSHTSFPQALALPDVADRMARYTSWSDVATSALR